MKFLGSDFNASKPEDSGYVRNPSSAIHQLAWEIKDLKTRIADFFGVCFNLQSENTTLKDNSIPYSVLKDSPDKPSSNGQYYQEVTVNSRGFVVAGNVNSTAVETSVYRAVFKGSVGHIETPEGVVTLNSTLTSSNGVQGSGPYKDGYSFQFVVPEGVKRILCRIIGGFATETYNFVSFGYPTQPNETLTVFCAAASGISYVASGNISGGRYPVYATSEAWTKGLVLDNDPLSIDNLLRSGSNKSPYVPKAETIGQLPRPGMVILEWYA